METCQELTLFIYLTYLENPTRVTIRQNQPDSTQHTYNPPPKVSRCDCISPSLESEEKCMTLCCGSRCYAVAEKENRFGKENFR